ncbi:MAG: YSIRK-type signal peptide-containing protein [Flavobacterium sp.]
MIVIGFCQNIFSIRKFKFG